MTECVELEQTHALADGELAGSDADRARNHLATCETCQAELAELMQLTALPAPAAKSLAPVISLAWYRRRNIQVATVAVAAAAAVVLFVATSKHPPGEPTPAHGVRVALASKRQLEARVSWGDAATYREYDVPRSGEAPHETIPLTTLADVERTGDVHGVAVLALLDGERKQAAAYLDRAGESPDVMSDRVALALADGHPERAVALADRVLDKQPGHAAALWNRGLALRDLGLLRGAAAAFRAVADRHERGWADEASKRAAALDADADALEHRFEHLNEASVALASGKLTMTIDDARAEPGYARGILYDAIRSAGSRERLAQLQPLADAIDAADHDTAVKDAIARAGAALHPELAKRYADMIRALSVEAKLTQAAGDEVPLPAGAARAQLLAQLRAVHADDLLIGVLMKLSDDRSTVNDSELAELVKLTAASPDPWMQMIGLQQQAQAALRRDDQIGAEAILLRARQRCTQGAPAYRCIKIGELIGLLYLKWQRLPEARAALADAWTLATKTGEWELQIELLAPHADLAVVGDDAAGSGLPEARAYSTEVVLRYAQTPDVADWRCQAAAWARTVVATGFVAQLQFAAARRELAGPTCVGSDDPAAAAATLFVRAELASQGGTPDEIAALRRDIATLRAALGPHAPQQVKLDHAEGRAIIDRDPVAGEALLRRAIAAGKLLPPSAVSERMPAAWSYNVLAIAMAKRGDGDGMLALIAEEQGLTVPKACVLGIAIDDQRRAFAARDGAGKTTVRYDEGRTRVDVQSDALVPADIVAAVAGCSVVDVLARPPIHGTARLLGDSIAWRYLSRRTGPVAPASDRKLVIANVEPPAALELPHLQTWSSDGEALSGPQATPTRVLAAIGAAGEVVVHAHGLVDVAQPDASYIALSPDPDGRFALTASEVRKTHFATSPLIILAACQASQAAPVYHETWSLPTALVYAGARAVIASAAPIPDAEAGEFFDAVRTKVHAGSPVAVAVRDARQAWLAAHRGIWVRDVIVFE